jgi:hypothetical protein
MAQLKMLKLPKRPRASASIATKEKYLAKVDAIKKENQRRKGLNDYGKKLDAKISGIGSATVLPNRFGAFSKRKKKAGGAKKKASGKRKSSKRR